MRWILSLLLCLGLGLAKDDGVPYLGLFLPSDLYFPSVATFCFHTGGDLGKFSSLTVNLETDSGDTNIYRVNGGSEPFHCPSFQVPAPSGTKQKVNIEIRGVTPDNMCHQIITKQVTIRAKRNGTFIQTDKSVYKPGQNVRFRIVTLNQDLESSNEKYSLVELQDPQKNRLAQWKDVAPNSGIGDLSFQLSPEPSLGMYTIKTGATRHYFSVEEYVLPKFEVMIHTPSTITIFDTNVTVTVCARYTYGQPVPGTVTFEICQKKGWSYWRQPRGQKQNPCYVHTEKNDPSGCLTAVVDLSHFNIRDNGYNRRLEIEASLEEEGTGVTINATRGQCEISSQITKLSFKDTKSHYQAGAPYRGKLVLQSFDGKPLSGQKLHLSVSLSEKSTKETLVTDSNGEASFQLSTSNWSEGSISLEASTDEEDEGYKRYHISARYGRAYLYLKDIYMSSRDSVYIHPVKSSAACHENVTVRVDYNLGERPKRDVDFFYLVLVNNKISLSGRRTVRAVNTDISVLSGTLELSLPVREMSPSGKILVFSVTCSGAVAADTATLQVSPCLKQQVSLGFSEREVIPGSEVKLHLKAMAGSFCALRVVDKSVVLMKPEDELTEAKIQNLVKPEPSYRPYESLDYKFCENQEPSNSISSTWLPDIFPGWRHTYSYPEKKKDVQNLIQDMGLTVLTTWDIVAPTTCRVQPYDMMPANSMMRSAPSATFASVMKATALEDDSPNEAAIESSQEKEIRTFFPETWLFDIQPIPSSGNAEMELIAPDSITEWNGQMFCTGAGSFALSPATTLKVFQPFFVGLTLPYSVKRGETFNLKATVFNYLLQCIKIVVTLPPSEDFHLKDPSGSDHTFCLCAGEKRTVTWQVTPTKLGEVNVTVASQAVSSPELCKGQEIVLPEKGRTDALTQAVLVEPEGTLVEQTHNALLICEESSESVERVNLELHQNSVEGSAKATISIFGDIMGSALNNIDDLLTMSYGCGEQNMVRFAPNIYILNYLDSSQQLSPEINKKAKDFLIGGYERQLQYKHREGSYSAFGESDKEGSTWLTAFVIKCFGQARPYVFIDEDVIKQGIQWLKKQQRSDGCFQAKGRLLNNALKGGVDDEVSLTGYILAALMETGMTPQDAMVEKGIKCLRNASIEDASTYKLALMAYAFTLADLTDARADVLQKLYNRAIKSDGLMYWTQESKPDPDMYWSKPKSVDVELTSYVLLTLASKKEASKMDLGDMVSIVRWLSKQQNGNGGFCSTQDTVVALQSLSKFASLTHTKGGNVTVTVISKEGFWHERHVDDSNRLILQKVSLPHIPGEYTVSAKGAGSVYVQITQRYHTPPPEKKAAFDLSVQTWCREKDVLEVEVQFRYHGERQSTNMVLLELKVISGYVPQKESIEKLKKNPLVKRVESKEDTVTIYIEEVTSQPQTLMIASERIVQVTDLKPAVLRIYDYYIPDDEKTITYLSNCP
ncbi:alpha-2-macroglobulin-like protein 1 [Spea bombifrons]|uniref:alpha-2-macroglobulin-like protein 1 n=1 Tax=Spea bombifrons TaxID=233779 RepID=UPI00234A8570|nr:alpha-2-macroglobulin-like protein 1 [Spea bombifrons]